MSMSQRYEESDEHFAGIEEAIAETQPKATLTVEFIKLNYQGLVGKLLTIVDASYTDPIQRKAVKDLVKSAVYTQLQWVVEYALNENMDGVAVDGVTAFKKKA